MIKKILSAVLAMTMVLSMAVSSSAALGKPGKVTSSTNTTQSTTSSSTSTTSRSSQAYDLCQTYLKNDTLALRMHNAILSGLRAANSRITVDISGYSENEVYTAFQTSLQMIFDEHPEIFWLDPNLQNVVISSNHKTLVFYPRPAAGYGTASSDGTTASTINTTAIQNTLTKMNNMVSKMTGSTRYELVKSIHDAIVNNTQYPANPDKASHNNHQAVGPLVEGEAVCDGYAKAFKYACDQKGIPCLIVVGTATNNIGETGTHAWNYVQMEDGKWYQVDTDWDDPQTKGGNSASYLIYDYFLQGNIVNSQRVKGSYSYPALASSDYAA